MNSLTSIVLTMKEFGIMVLRYNGNGVKEVMMRVRTVSDAELKAWTDFFKNRGEVAAVYLFGSYGTEFEHPNSDIDLGIVFSRIVTFVEELAIDADLSLFLASDKVDLVNLNRAPVALQFQALADGLQIYEGEYIAHSNFIERVLKNYFDYKISYARFSEDYEHALREDYLKHGG